MSLRVSEGVFFYLVDALSWDLGVRRLTVCSYTEEAHGLSV